MMQQSIQVVNKGFSYKNKANQLKAQLQHCYKIIFNLLKIKLIYAENWIAFRGIYFQNIESEKVIDWLTVFSN